MLAAKHKTFKSTMGFLGKLLDVQAVHHAVNRDQHMRLFVIRIDALTDSDQANAGEVQSLEDAQRILCIAGEAAAVIEQDDIEGTSGRQSSIQQAAKPRTIRTDAAQSFIDVDVLFEKDESTGKRILAANPKLVFNRAWTL